MDRCRHEINSSIRWSWRVEWGISSLAKVKNATKVTKAVIGLATDTGISTASQAAKKGKVSIKETVVDVAAGRIAGSLTGKVLKNNKQAGKLQVEVNRQKNIARGKSNTVPKRKADVAGSQKKLNSYGAKRATAASATASGAGTKIYEKTVGDKNGKTK